MRISSKLWCYSRGKVTKTGEFTERQQRFSSLCLSMGILRRAGHCLKPVANKSLQWTANRCRCRPVAVAGEGVVDFAGEPIRFVECLVVVAVITLCAGCRVQSGGHAISQGGGSRGGYPAGFSSQHGPMTRGCLS